MIVNYFFAFCSRVMRIMYTIMTWSQLCMAFCCWKRGMFALVCPNEQWNKLAKKSCVVLIMKTDSSICGRGANSHVDNLNTTCIYLHCNVALLICKYRIFLNKRPGCFDIFERGGVYLKSFVRYK